MFAKLNWMFICIIGRTNPSSTLPLCSAYSSWTLRQTSRSTINAHVPSHYQNVEDVSLISILEFSSIVTIPFTWGNRDLSPVIFKWPATQTAIIEMLNRQVDEGMTLQRFLPILLRSWRVGAWLIDVRGGAEARIQDRVCKTRALVKSRRKAPTPEWEITSRHKCERGLWRNPRRKHLRQSGKKFDWSNLYFSVTTASSLIWKLKHPSRFWPFVMWCLDLHCRCRQQRTICVRWRRISSVHTWDWTNFLVSCRPTEVSLIALAETVTSELKRTCTSQKLNWMETSAGRDTSADSRNHFWSVRNKEYLQTSSFRTSWQNSWRTSKLNPAVARARTDVLVLSQALEAQGLPPLPVQQTDGL